MSTLCDGRVQYCVDQKYCTPTVRVRTQPRLHSIAQVGGYTTTHRAFTPSLDLGSCRSMPCRQTFRTILNSRANSKHARASHSHLSRWALGSLTLQFTLCIGDCCSNREEDNRHGMGSKVTSLVVVKIRRVGKGLAPRLEMGHWGSWSCSPFSFSSIIGGDAGSFDAKVTSSL